jgi:CO/xanthine dehydrogenase Mo-binding subunit
MSSTVQEAPGVDLRIFESPEYRVEGREKVTGTARYTADDLPEGTLYAGFYGSPVPRARIRSVDVSRARALPGVHAVLTGADIGMVRFGRRLLDMPVLAVDEVRFIGDRIAAVAAETRELVDEALALIEVDLEELPGVFDVREALTADAPILHPQSAEYRYLGGDRPPVPHPNVQGHVHVEKGDGDIEAIFASAPHLFEHTFRTPRQHHGFIEPHATVVWTEPDDRVHVITTNKAPFSLRSQMAASLGIDPEKLDIESNYIGGDFGGKGYSTDEYPCYFLARETGRPIKAVRRYVDEIVSTNTRHASLIRLRTAVDDDGRLLAHDAEVLFDGGAYAAAKPLAHLVVNGGLAGIAPYRVPRTRFDVRTVYTNTVPAGHMRSPGEVQAIFAGESHLDMIATELGIDPLEFRLRNVVRDGDRGPTGEAFREPRAVEILEALRDASGWGNEVQPQGRGWGLGIAVRHVGGGKLSLPLRLEPDGRIVASIALPDQGNGATTIIRRVAAAVLSIDPERIVFDRGSTAVRAADPGVGGSRVTHLGSQAAFDAATRLRERLEELAPGALGVPEGSVELRDDAFHASSGRLAGFGEAAARIAAAGPIEVVGSYDAGGAQHADEPGDFNFVGYAIQADVDADTGQVTVLRVILAADVGTIFNPIAHQGQLDGGFVFGLGSAVMEELVLEQGQITTTSFAEVKLETMADIPPLETILLPTRVGPGAFGAKGIGELSNISVAPALANAIRAACGVRIQELPLTAERVHDALHGDAARA